MSVTPDEQKVLEPMQDSTHFSFITEGDAGLYFSSASSSGAINVLNRTVFSFSPFDFAASGFFNGGTPIQWKKLQWYMQLFEEFTLAKVTWHWHPRWTQIYPQPANVYNGGTNYTNGNMNVQADINGMSGDYQNMKYITIMGDKTDSTFSNVPVGQTGYSQQVAITDGIGLDEYYGARTCSHAHTFPMTEAASGAIIPHQYDVMQSYNATAFSYGATGGSAVSGGSDGSSAQRMQWKTCRVANTGGTINATDLNPSVYVPFVGMKLWIYDDYNRTTALSQRYQIGFLTLKYHWMFRGREYRPTFDPISFAGETPDLREKVRKIMMDLGIPDGPPDFMNAGRIQFALRKALTEQTDAQSRPTQGTPSSLPAQTSLRPNPVSELLSKRLRTQQP